MRKLFLFLFLGIFLINFISSEVCCEKTINNADCDVVVSGTPIDITRVLQANKPIVRIKYEVGDATVKELEKIVDTFVKIHC